MALQGKKKVHFVSLGCDKNLVDSEKALSILYKEGYEYTDEPFCADVIVVNTCCFIRDAKEESVDAILDMVEVKKSLGEAAPLLVVMGCMAERYKQEISDTLPEVDIIIGTNSWQDLAELIREKENNLSGRTLSRFAPISDNTFLKSSVTDRFITTAGHFAYLKIAEGCGKNCTYCIIPYLRGAYRSVPLDDLVKEAENLAESGIKELILVAQETTLYGIDLYGKKMLPELLKRLNAIEGLRWIRILYCYPEEITDELIDAIRDLPKVCKYLDIPIQSASDHILRRMARRTTHDEITALIGKLRERIPGIALRTTLIAGFPGETLKDHEATLDFVRDMKFDRLGVFEYSREEGTKAAGFSHQVSAANKAKRKDEIMSLQMEIAGELAASRIGQVLEVMIEGRLTEDAAIHDLSEIHELEAPEAAALEADCNIYVGRSYMDTPDVDGLIYINTGKREFMTGDMVNVRVTGANAYDLIGDLV